MRNYDYERILLLSVMMLQCVLLHYKKGAWKKETTVESLKCYNLERICWRLRRWVWMLLARFRWVGMVCLGDGVVTLGGLIGIGVSCRIVKSSKYLL